MIVNKFKLCVSKQKFYLLLALAFLSVPASSNATPPTPPATIVFDKEKVKGELAGARGEIILRIQIRAEAAVKVVEMKAFLAPTFARNLTAKKEQVFGRRIQLADEKQRSYELPVKISGPGDYELEVTLRGEIGSGNAFSDRLIRHIRVDENGNYWILTGRQITHEARKQREERFYRELARDPGHPDIRLLLDQTTKVPAEIAKGVRPLEVERDRQLEVRPVGPSELLAKYSVDNSQKSWAAKDPITVRGRLVFQDFDGVWRPLVNVSVNLWDEDWDWDEHLGTTVTNWNGDWSFSVNNNDGWGADGRDIYYSFKLANTRIRVEDCDGIDSTYEWESAVVDDRPDGAVVDFGTETGGSDAKTMQIWNQLNLAWNHAVVAGGQDPGFVDSCFPYESTEWDPNWEEVDIEEQYNDGPDVIFHEYGHALMYYAYDEDDPSPGDSHTFDDMSQNASLSWSEGWATGFMLSARPDGVFNWHEGDGGRNIENFSASNRVGERNEGRVAAALFDMLDPPDDGNGGNEDRGRKDYADGNAKNLVSLATMLRDTLWGGYHSDFLSFWPSLSGELTSEQRTPAHTILYYNWMSVPEPGSCVASKVVAGQEKESESILSGLRKFRDLALKPFDGGRQLINIYYRNSPEMGLLLLNDPELRGRALEVVKHYASVGTALNAHATHQRVLRSKEPVIPPALHKTISAIIARMAEKGSTELRQDLHKVQLQIDKVHGLTFEELQQKIEGAKRSRGDGAFRLLRQSTHNPASAEAAKSKALRDLNTTVKPPPDLEKQEPSPGPKKN